jgi:Gram-negative bacterial TonB protein C-terminal
MRVKSTLQILIAAASVFTIHSSLAATVQTSSNQSNPNAGLPDNPDAISPPQIVFSVEPDVPESVRKRRPPHAQVSVALYVETDGTTSNVKAIRTDYFHVNGQPDTRPVDPDVTRALENSAVNAVSQYRFKPARRKDGTPVRAQMNITVDFQLL